MINYRFPEDFKWGSSTSGLQSEGTVMNDGKGWNEWDYWFSIEPFKFHNEVGPQTTSTFYENYQHDLTFLKETGHTIFRPSIQWSRLIPDGIGEVNQKAVAFYRDVFKRIKAMDIELMVNLYHFDLPYPLVKEGGWENKATIEAYIAYAKTCFELFGDLVDRWTTFNEPFVHVEMGYLYQYHYPMKVDAKAAVQVAFNTQVASSGALKALKEYDSQSKGGIILNLTPAYPRSQHPSDLKAAEMAELIQARSFLDPSVHGVYPEKLIQMVQEHEIVPVHTAEELALLNNHRVDFLGVNYYQPLRVKAPQYAWNPASPLLPEYYYEPFEMPGRKVNPHRGWEIYPQGLYDISMNLKENYNNIEWILTENGMGVENEERFMVDGVIQDDYRIDYLKDHLKELHRGIQAGSNCKGYMMWTFIDCWSWLNAYKNRYGFVSLDVETQEKTIKKSGHWFKKVSDQSGF